MRRAAVVGLTLSLALAGRASAEAPAGAANATPSATSAANVEGAAATANFPGGGRIIARSAPPSGNVTTTVPGPPPTAAAVPKAPPSGPLLYPAPSDAARLENAPPAHSALTQSARATENRLPAAPDPLLGTIANPLTRAERSPSGPTQACVDTQLARRGLNAYGDPPATRYPNGLPVPADSIRRYSYVLARSPLIASQCEAARPFH